MANRTSAPTIRPRPSPTVLPRSTRRLLHLGTSRIRPIIRHLHLRRHVHQCIRRRLLDHINDEINPDLRYHHPDPRHQQEQHSQRLTSASLNKQDATSGGTVRSECCYKVQSRRPWQAPQHEPDKSTPVRTTLVVARTPRPTPVGGTLPFSLPLSRGD